MAKQMEQNMEWLEAQKIEISVDLVASAKQHLEFLGVVDQNQWLYDGPSLERAIFRYNAYWLPLLAKYTESSSICEGPLVPPLDCEWIWHCHRLNPLRYKSDCEEFYGRVLDNSDVVSSVNGSCKLQTENLWKRLYPMESYDLDLDKSISELKEISTLEKCTTYDLVSAVKRQSSFYSEVSRAVHVDNDMQDVVARYKAFLYLIKRNIEKSVETSCVPTYDIDLIWHTHQLNPSSYCKDLEKMFGNILQHDDTDSGQSEGNKLDTSFSGTTTQWEETFGQMYWKVGAEKTPLMVAPKKRGADARSFAVDEASKKHNVGGRCFSIVDASEKHMNHNAGARCLAITDASEKLRAGARCLAIADVSEKHRAGARCLAIANVSEKHRAGARCLAIADVSKKHRAGARCLAITDASEKLRAGARCLAISDVSEKHRAGARCLAIADVSEKHHAGARCLAIADVSKKHRAGARCLAITDASEKLRAGVRYLAIADVSEKHRAGARCLAIVDASEKHRAGVRCLAIVDASEKHNVGARCFAITNASEKHHAGARCFAIADASEKHIAGARCFAIADASEKHNVGARCFSIVDASKKHNAGARCFAKASKKSEAGARCLAKTVEKCGAGARCLAAVAEKNGGGCGNMMKNNANENVPSAEALNGTVAA